MTWKPNSWRQKTITQVPEYPDKDVLKSVENILKYKPPLVFAGEVQNLTEKLGNVCKGKEKA